MSADEFQEQVFAAAQEYIARGWYLFPLHSINDEGFCTCGSKVCSDAGKHPRVKRWQKECSIDPEKILAWFGPEAPRSNIGLVTGEVSGITVLDIDIGPGKFGADSWAEAIKDHGEPDTLMARTGSGGMHAVFVYNSSLKTAANVLGKGVDCRNDGGYIVAAPSRHRSGGRYEWMNPDGRIAVLPAHLSRRKESRGRKKKDDMYNSKYSIEQVKGMLDCVPADDRDFWRAVGVILGRVFSRADEAWQLYQEWSDKWGGAKGRNHDQIMAEAFYTLSQETSDKELSLGTIVKAAMEHGWAPKKGEVPVGNFVYYGPGNNFIYRPTVTHWIAAAVDAAVSPVNEDGKIVPASQWLQENCLITSMTKDPSIEEDVMKGYDCRDGEISRVPGAALFNSYRKPTIELGDARLAGPFIEHVCRVFNKPGDADQFLDYMSHRVQKPWEKPRFSLLLAGAQGVGKDTAVEFCCPAIGVWNVSNIAPADLESNFNEYAASTLVRISEAANLHEMTKWAFNESTKVLIAGNPDTATINPKYGQKYSVRMYCGVIVTTNHLANGIYIPPDDRRYDVIDAATKAEMGIEDDDARRNYFEDLWTWFLRGGANHIAAYLHERDIKKFSASNGQRKTAAHKAVVQGGMAGDNWLDDILDAIDYPTAVQLETLVSMAAANGEKESDARKRIPNVIPRLGYFHLANKDDRQGRWKIKNKKYTVFLKEGTPVAGFDPGAFFADAKEPF